MNEQDQIKAIAELDGKHFWTGDEQERDCDICGGKPPAKQHNVGDYLHSYDAIIPVIVKQNYRIKKDVFAQLACGLRAHPDPDLAAMLATPSQLSKALLRATGKWID